MQPVRLLFHGLEQIFAINLVFLGAKLPKQLGKVYMILSLTSSLPLFLSPFLPLFPFKFAVFHDTKCPKVYRKSVVHLLNH